MDLNELKSKELRAKNLVELNEILAEATSEYADMKFQSATGQIENTAKIRMLRRSIARIKTLVKEKEMAE